MSPAQVSRVMNDLRTPGYEFCQAIARAFKIPEEEVLEQAGILAHPSPALKLFSQLSNEQREAILREMRKMVAEQQWRRGSVVNHSET